MTIDDLARTASADLNASVRRTVSADHGRAALNTRLRRRRAAHGVAAVALVALSAAGVAVVRDRTADQAVPGSPPTVDRTALPASGCLFDVRCIDGTYRAALAVPTTFSLAGVLDVSSDTASQLDLTEINDTFALTLLADPGAAQPNGRPLPGTGPESTAQELVEALQTRPDLQVSTPTAAEVAGRPAVVVDVRARPGAKPKVHCPGQDCFALFTSEDAGGGWASTAGLGPYEVDRIFLVDVPGSGTVAVLVRDRTEGAYAPMVALAQVTPILHSLAFGE